MSESKPIVLRSASNPTIRHLVRMRDNRARRKAGRVLTDGWRETAAAIDAKLELLAIYLPESMMTVPGRPSDDPQSDRNDDPGVEDDPDVVGRLLGLARKSPKTVWLSHPMMERIGYGQGARGIVAEFAQPDFSLAELLLPPNPFLLVLDQIEKPGNIGAVFRCAEAAGVDAVLLCESGDPMNPNAIRSSLGCVFHVPLATGTQSELLQFLGLHSVRVLAARVESAQPLWSIDLSGPLAVVLGSEATGLGDRWQHHHDQAPIEGVKIPMRGNVDSLNVSVSAAVIAFEASRRRSPGEIV